MGKKVEDVSDLMPGPEASFHPWERAEPGRFLENEPKTGVACLAFSIFPLELRYQPVGWLRAETNFLVRRQFADQTLFSCGTDESTMMRNGSG
ncbi:hypothetical protein [Rufibacter aurantiacus]|uniref:hypothetical protein n=1 Tax=Rufibacter aurantiacus TaxID=2817374 RepID=UPI001B30C5D0|nr:hypothetical protein [Rufibacter aurantiacus]